MEQSDWSPSVEFCPLYNDQVVKCRWIKFYINSLSILHLINRVQYVIPSLNWKNERDILKYKVCVYSCFFFLHKNDTSDLSYQILCSETGFLHIRYSLFNNTHISFQGWNWSCRYDMDLQGWHRFLWCFLFLL